MLALHVVGVMANAPSFRCRVCAFATVNGCCCCWVHGFVSCSIGQRRDVRVYRFTVRATVEDRILKLQEHKRKLVLPTSNVVLPASFQPLAQLPCCCCGCGCCTAGGECIWGRQHGQQPDIDEGEAQCARSGLPSQLGCAGSLHHTTQRSTTSENVHRRMPRDSACAWIS